MGEWICMYVFIHYMCEYKMQLVKYEFVCVHECSHTVYVSVSMSAGTVCMHSFIIELRHMYV